MNKLVLSLILLFQVLKVFGQIENDAIRQMVLNDERIDSLYVFGKWDEKGANETHLKYLGELQTKKGVFKIMTSIWLWGFSKRATSRILVYNDRSEYLGNFRVTLVSDLPEKIENNQIVFFNDKKKECDESILTKLSFDEGIPESFFLRCASERGDVYYFEKNK